MMTPDPFRTHLRTRLRTSVNRIPVPVPIRRRSPRASAHPSSAGRFVPDTLGFPSEGGLALPGGELERRVLLTTLQSLIFTSEGSTGAVSGTEQLTIGEIVRLRLVASVNEGVTANFSLRDLLPDGLTFLNDGTAKVAFVANQGSIVSSTAGIGAGPSVVGNAPVTPTFVLPVNAIAGGPFGSGTDPVFQLGNLTNPDSDADTEYVVLDFNAICDNDPTTLPVNQAGRLLSNSFQVLFNNVVNEISADLSMRVAEPDLNPIAFTATPSVVGPGGTVTFKYVISAANTPFATTAFDVDVNQAVPPAFNNLRNLSVTSSIGSIPNSLGLGANSLTGTISQIQPGVTVTITFQVDAAPAVIGVIPVSAAVGYTSLPGTNGTNGNPTGSQAGTAGSNTGERIAGITHNDYQQTLFVNVTVQPIPIGGTINYSASLSSTNQVTTTGNNVAVGETAQLKAVLTLDPGTYTLAKFTESLPAGLALKSIDTLNAAPTVTSSLGSFASVLAQAQTTLNAPGQSFTMDFGTLTNSDTNPVTIEIRYTVVALNILSNQSGTNLTNNGTFEVTGQSVTSAITPLVVVEPTLNISISASPTQADIGDLITFTVTVTHNPGTNASAFDVRTEDIIPTGYVYVAGSHQYVSGLSPTFSNIAGLYYARYAQFDPGSTSTYTYQARIDPTATPGNTYVNNILLLYSSLPGPVTAPQTAFNANSVERDGDSAGAINDYWLSKNDSVTLRSNSIAGFVYADDNNNGLFDSTEAPIPGVTVTLTGKDKLGNPVNITVVTNVTGQYKFDLLSPSDNAGYTITETQPAAHSDGKDALGSAGGIVVSNDVLRVVLPAGVASAANGYNFGERPLPGAVQGRVFIDSNQNGVFDPGENPLAFVTMTLSGVDFGGSAVNVTTNTDASGKYTFSNISPSNAAGYTVTEPAVILPNLLDDRAIPGNQGGAANGPNQITGIPVFSSTTSDNYRFTELRPVRLSGFVYVDANSNGAFDGGEQPLSGAPVNLDGFDDRGNPVNLSTFTDAAGQYLFANLRPSGPVGYRITEAVQPPGYPDGIDTIGTAGGVVGNDVFSQIVVTENTNGQNYNFGEGAPNSVVKGFVYLDANANGIRDGGEIGLPNVTVRLKGDSFLGTPVDLTTQTDALGQYVFNSVPASDGIGFTLSQPTQPPAYLDGSEILGNSGGTAVEPDQIRQILVSAGDLVQGYGFGEILPAQISGSVFEDKNNDGNFNLGDLPLNGVSLTLSGVDDRGAAVNRNVVTDAAGLFLFDRLRPSGPGGYTLTESQPVAYFDGKHTVGTLGGNLLPNNVVAGITVHAGDNGSGYAFGELKAGSIEGVVYIDQNLSGGLNAGDLPFPGVEVILTGRDDLGQNLVISAFTDAAGIYRFTGLRPSDANGYAIREVQPVGYPDGAETLGNAGGVMTNDQFANILVKSGTVGNGYFFGEQPRRADLELTLSSNTTTPDVGEDVTFHVQVRNTGPSDADGVQTAIPIPAGWTLINSSTANGAFAPGTSVWSIGSLPVGTVADLTLVLRIAAPAPQTLTAEVSASNPPDPDSTPANGNPSEDDLGRVTIIPKRADLSVTLGVSNATPGIGDVITYLVTITNAGPDPAQAVQLSANLPSTVNFVGFTAGSGTFNSGTGKWSVASIPVGGTATLQLNARVVTPNPGDAVVEILQSQQYDPDSTPGNGNPAEDDIARIRIEPLPLSSLSGRVSLDTNQNGVNEPTDPGLPNVVVNLVGVDVLGNPVSLNGSTDAFGLYHFDNLFPGTYSIIEVQPVRYNDGAETLGLGGLGGTIGSDQFTNILVLANQNGGGYLFGERGTFISGTAYHDRNRSGNLDPSETPLAGVAIQLFENNVLVASTTTNNAGVYKFDNLPSGPYEIRETQPLGYGSSTPNQLGVMLPLTGLTGQNFGETTAELRGTVFVDDNRDGIRQLVENGLAGVPINLRGIDVLGNVIDVTMNTDVDGNYLFTDLLEGEYRLSQEQPLKFLDGRETAGTFGGNLSVNDTIGAIAVPAGGLGNNYLFAEIIMADVSLVLDVNNLNPRLEEIVTLFVHVANAGPSDATGLAINLPLPSGLTFVNSVSDVGGFDARNAVWNVGNLASGGSAVLRINALVTGGILDLTAQVAASDQFDIDSTPKNDNADEDDQSSVRIVTKSELNGTVYLDLGKNGRHDPQDLGLSDVGIILTGVDYLGNTVRRTVETDAQGRYRIQDVLPGTYSLTEEQPDTLRDGSASVGSAGGLASSNLIQGIRLGSGIAATGYDFGEIGVSIQGTVFVDGNRNEFRDAAEDALSGVTLNLHDGRGALLATTVSDINGGYTFDNLPTGEYTVEEEQPLGYGSSTANDVNVFVTLSGRENVNFGETTGSIRGSIFIDPENDGMLGASDIVLAGVPVELSGFNILGESILVSALTDENGEFLFTGLLTGSYTLTKTPPAGLLDGRLSAGTAAGIIVDTNTFSKITLSPGQDATDYYFGELRPAEISARTFFDRNQNGVFDDNDTSISGVEFLLDGLDDLGSVVRLTGVSDAQGYVKFSNLRPTSGGGFTLREVQPANYRDGADFKTSDLIPGTAAEDLISGIVLSEGFSLSGYRFTEQGFPISGVVFLDPNRDGQRDGGDIGLGNVAITIRDGITKTVLLTTTSDDAGAYGWNDLLAGSYQVAVTAPAGYLFTTADFRDINIGLNLSSTASFGLALIPVEDPITTAPIVNTPDTSTTTTDTSTTSTENSNSTEATNTSSQVFLVTATGPAINSASFVSSATNAVNAVSFGGNGGNAMVVAQSTANAVTTRYGNTTMDSDLDLRDAGFRETFQDKLNPEDLSTNANWEDLALQMAAMGIGRQITELQPLQPNTLDLDLIAVFPDIYQENRMQQDSQSDKDFEDQQFLDQLSFFADNLKGSQRNPQDTSKPVQTAATDSQPGEKLPRYLEQILGVEDGFAATQLELKSRFDAEIRSTSKTPPPASAVPIPFLAWWQDAYRDQTALVDQPAADPNIAPAAASENVAPATPAEAPVPPDTSENIDNDVIDDIDDAIETSAAAATATPLEAAAITPLGIWLLSQAVSDRMQLRRSRSAKTLPKHLPHMSPRMKNPRPTAKSPG